MTTTAIYLNNTWVITGFGDNISILKSQDLITFATFPNNIGSTYTYLLNNVSATPSTDNGVANITFTDLSPGTKYTLTVASYSIDVTTRLY
jgi:hypothetical protein